MSLESIPTYFSDFFDITLAAAQTILSIVVILAVILPLAYVAKGRYVFIQIILLFLIEAFLVGIGWLPFWLLIATVAAMALAIATLGTNTVIGE